MDSSSTIDFIDEKNPYGAMTSVVDGKSAQLENLIRPLGYPRSLKTTARC